MPKHFNIGVKGIVRVGDACLVLKKKTDTGVYWDIPGGRIEDDETLEMALNREMKEELPTIQKYEVGELVSVFRLSYDLPDKLGLLLVSYKLTAQPFEVKLSSEHSDYKWVTKETVTELLTSGVKIESGFYEAIVKALS